MQEIWIPIAIITLFLFLPVIRPFFKKLGVIDGLAWLPLPALLTALAMIPAYGLRPEALPLFLYAAVLTGINISALTGGGGVKFENFGEKHFILPVLSLILLVAAAGIAFFFTPQKDTALSTQGVHTFKVKTGASNGKPGRVVEDTTGKTGGETEYSIRIYTEENDSRSSPGPLLVLLPPAFGSLAAIDQVCGELRNRGFTVLTYARKGFGSWRAFRSINAFFSGNVSARANARGRALEEARKEDLLFLLSWIRGNPAVGEKLSLFDVASPDAVFLAGYDAGASALILLGNSLSFERTAGGSGGIKIRGLIAIESPLWSVYREEIPHIPDLPSDSGWFESVRHGLNRWFWEMKPKNITGLGQIPELSVPLLFLISDRGREGPHSSRRYLALLGTFKAARGPAVLASVDGAGPLDYSDFPVLYPLISALLSGRMKPVRNNLEAPGETACIITNFAAGILEAEGEPAAEAGHPQVADNQVAGRGSPPGFSPLQKPPLPAGVQISSNKSAQR